MQNWDDVIAVSFVETSAYDGDINFGNLTNSPNTQAYSRIPTDWSCDHARRTGCRNRRRRMGFGRQASNFQFDEGHYGLNTLVHEVGHSLGLSHPGAYNFGPGFAVTYANGAEYAQDARNYSIMSYWNPRDLGMTATGVVTRDFDWSLMAIAYGSTPMIHDILAAQKMYGVDTTTRTGDTVYGFNSNAGRDPLRLHQDGVADDDDLGCRRQRHARRVGLQRQPGHRPHTRVRSAASAAVTLAEAVAHAVVRTGQCQPRRGGLRARLAGDL